jgi:hypothetical protein
VQTIAPATAVQGDGLAGVPISDASCRRQLGGREPSKPHEPAYGADRSRRSRAKTPGITTLPPWESRPEGVAKHSAGQREAEGVVLMHNVGDEAEAGTVVKQAKGRGDQCLNVLFRRMHIALFETSDCSEILLLESSEHSSYSSVVLRSFCTLEGQVLWGKPGTEK